MEAEALRIDIIRPSLKLTDTWSMAAENLILFTGAAETGYRVLKQLKGPGLGPYSMEPMTYRSAVDYLQTRQPVKCKQILEACHLEIFPEASALIWNMRLATIMCRMRYWWHVEPLPEHNDIEGLARYWKNYYNTTKGKGTIEHFLRAVKELR